MSEVCKEAGVSPDVVREYFRQASYEKQRDLIENMTFAASSTEYPV